MSSTSSDHDSVSACAHYPRSMTTTASEDRKDVLQQWKDNTADRKMILAVIGRSGTGKTTLINNMLGIKCENDDGGETTAIHSHNDDIEDVRIEIFDTPGLGMPGQNEKQILGDLQLITEKKADVLLYCMSVLPNSKMDDKEIKIIKYLTHMFGKYVWEKVIIVFTFANIILQINDGDMDRLRSVTQSYAEEFQKTLKRIGVDCMISMYDSVDTVASENQQDHPHTILLPTLPAGRSQQLPDGTRWDIKIYEEVLKKCEKDDTPSLLHYQKCACVVQ